MISNTSAPSPANPVLMPGAYAVSDLAKAADKQRLARLTQYSTNRSGAGKDKQGGKDGKGGESRKDGKSRKSMKSRKSEKKVTDMTPGELEKRREKQRLAEKRRVAKQSIADEVSRAWKEAEGFHLLPVPGKPPNVEKKPDQRTLMACTHLLKTATTITTAATTAATIAAITTAFPPISLSRAVAIA